SGSAQGPQSDVEAAAEAEPGGRGVRAGAGYPVVGHTGGSAEDEEVTAAQFHVGVGTVAGLGVAEAEDAGVPEAEGDHGHVGVFVLVLVHAHARVGVVEVDQGDVVGRVPVGDGTAEGCGQGPVGQ